MGRGDKFRLWYQRMSHVQEQEAVALIVAAVPGVLQAAVLKGLVRS